MDTLFTIVSVLMSSALFVGIVIATINFILGKNVLAKHAPVENNSEITDENETNCFGNAQNDEIIDKAEYVKPATYSERKLFGIPLKTALVVLGTAVASRLITYIIAAIVSETYLFSETFFVRWDANHYLNLAKLGYSGYTESCSCGTDAPIFLVFFPLYPLLVKLFSLITFGNYYAAALIISNTAFVAAAVFLYKLTEKLFNKSIAVTAVILLSFAPFSLFFSAPFTESVFLLCTTACAYFAHENKMLASSIFGFFAALSRMVGVLTVIVIFTFKAAHVLSNNKFDSKKQAVGALLKILPYLFPVIVGTCIYLIINLTVAGNAFAFTFYQSNHWSNHFETVYYSLKLQWTQLASRLNSYSINGEDIDLNVALGVHLNNIIAFIVSTVTVFILALKNDRKQIALALFLGITAVINFSISWLLSGARYTFAMFPVYIAFATLTKNRYAKALTVAACFVLFISSIILFDFGQVY